MDDPSSHHAQLELAILGSELAVTHQAGVKETRSSPDVRVVLILASDPEMCAYIGICLKTLDAAYTIEAVTVNEIAERSDRIRPDLVVIEAHGLFDAARLLGSLEAMLHGVPRLLILDERVPDDGPVILGPFTVIRKPFNAERLLEAASTLLG